MTKNVRFKHQFFLLIVFSFSFVSLYGQSANSNDTLKLCFLSDTQEPLIFERLLLEYNNNSKARALIFKKIIKIAPRAVIHLGDFTGLSFLDDGWKETKDFVRDLSRRKSEFLPIPGNHEYILFPKKSISNFKKLFKGINLTGYSKQINNLAIVLFNSNFANLEEWEIKQQRDWYNKTISEYESDPSIDFIITGTHYSPYTNSRIVLPATESSFKEYFNQYLEVFYNSKKCILFVSGHAHAFEHFKVRGKDFLVIGGGGGIQQPLYIDKNEKYRDLFSSKIEKRMYHFITVKVFNKALAVELDMINDTFTNFREVPQLEFQVKNP